MTARVGVLVLALCVALDVADAASLVNAGQHADEEISSDREKRQSFDLMVSFSLLFSFVFISLKLFFLEKQGNIFIPHFMCQRAVA